LISIHTNKFLNLQSQHITVIERQRGGGGEWTNSHQCAPWRMDGWMDDKWSQQQFSVEFQFPGQPWWLAQLLFLLPTY
jgi:hypothetical protein